ncbi:hypothetical protein [Azospirillum rugosum]|uniref:Uncharacterized protein n=1 Tax=Azospirillum rugosum TaxID=416170 RepID=A0ABS4STL2_9PROT|nr:hypothetical protein [Azospirillum rugosum]MBP2295888.1 hypothetical protein [Azospirillum rugosum]MDQ0530145.1 hypothetical protein [Azospirillum rugosum]
MTAPSATARAALAAFLLAGPAIAGLAGHPLPAWASESPRFLTGMGDVPVMPGLAPAEEEPLVFDKPGGRIAQSVMAGRVDRKAVLAFYNQTMPQLGWKAAPQAAAAGTRFLRDGEELRLEFVEPGAAQAQASSRAGVTTVRFSLMPH